MQYFCEIGEGRAFLLKEVMKSRTFEQTHLLRSKPLKKLKNILFVRLLLFGMLGQKSRRVAGILLMLLPRSSHPRQGDCLVNLRPGIYSLLFITVLCSYCNSYRLE